MISTAERLDRRLTNATLVIATLVTLMLPLMPLIRGGWLLTSPVTSLWFFWMGILLSRKIMLKPGARWLCIVPFVILYIFPFYGMEHNVDLFIIYYPLGSLLRFSATFLLGWAFSPKCEEVNHSVETLMTFATFFVLLCFMNLACRRIVLAGKMYNVEMLKMFVPIIYCNIETIPLLGTLYFAYKSSMTTAVQKSMDIRWVRRTCKTLCITLFSVLIVSIIGFIFVGRYVSYIPPKSIIEFLRDIICGRLGELGSWGIICSPVSW